MQAKSCSRLFKYVWKEVYLNSETAQKQTGFRRGRGTRDRIANIRWILEKSREMSAPVYLCFIDNSKAFDCVDHNKLWNSMRRLRIPEYLTTLIKRLYTGQEAIVRKEFGNTEWFHIGNGVRRGCMLSRTYSTFTVKTFSHCRSRGIAEINIGGRPLNNLRDAEDTTLIANSKEDLTPWYNKSRMQVTPQVWCSM